MDNKQQILQELQDLSPLIADIQSINPYEVPAGYFAGLSEVVLEKLRIETVLTGGSAGTYATPEGYFEGLSARILNKIKNGTTISESRVELEEVAPFLNTISRTEIYTLPAGYFEQVDFAKKVLKPEAKVVTFRIARKWMQYAAAAMMTGILVTGAFLFTDDRSNLDIEKTERTDVSSTLNTVGEADLVKYLDNPEHFVAAPAATSLASEAELADVKNNIQRLSDEELNQYLKENAEAFETPVSEKE